jgi:hypothetical protein
MKRNPDNLKQYLKFINASLSGTKPSLKPSFFPVLLFSVFSMGFNTHVMI